MATDTAFAQFEQLLLEEVEPSVHGLELPTDDVAWNLMDTFPAIERAGRNTAADGTDSLTTDYTDGYECSWRIRLNRGGRVSGGSFGGNSLTRMGPDNLINAGQSVDDLYLDPAHTPMPSWAKIRLGLCKLEGQITANREQILKELIARSIEDVAADTIDDAVYQVRAIVTSLFWSTKGVFALNNGGDSVSETTPTAVAVDGGSPFRFVEGQRYVAAALTAGVPTTWRGNRTDGTPGVVRCVGIDTDSRDVMFQSEPGEGTIVITDNDGILPEGMYTPGFTRLAPNGINDLIVTSGVYPGTAYNVATHKHLKAYVSDNTATPVDPTPELVAGMCDKVTDPGYEPPTTLVAERSIWTYYSQLERANQAIYTVAQGAPFTASGGVTAPVISHGNYTFAKLSSSKCDPGTIYGMAPETFRRFMPGGGKTLRWATQNGGVAGLNSIFHPIYSGRQLSKVSAADFELWLQFGQVMPRRLFALLGVLSQRAADAA